MVKTQNDTESLHQAAGNVSKYLINKPPPGEMWAGLLSSFHSNSKRSYMRKKTQQKKNSRKTQGQIGLKKLGLSAANLSVPKTIVLFPWYTRWGFITSHIVCLYMYVRDLGG